MRYVIERGLCESRKGYRSFGDLPTAEQDWRVATLERDVHRVRLFSIDTTDPRASIDIVKAGRATLVRDSKDAPRA